MQPKKKLTTKQQSKRKQVELSTRKTLGIKIGIGVFVFVAVLTVFIRLPFFRIRAIEVEGNQLIKSDDVMETLWIEMRGNHGLFVPNSHIFLMQKEELESKLVEQFPRISDIRIERGKLHSLVVLIEEHPHTFLWCATVATTDCYFADDNGLLFAKAPYFSGNVFMTFVGGDAQIDAPIESHILNNADEFRKLVLMMQAFDNAGFKIDGVTIGTNREYTLHVPRIHNARTPEADIIATTKLAPETVISNIMLTMDTEKFKNSFVASPSTLDYIDARLTEKVFYKFGVTAPVQPVIDVPITAE